MSYEVIEFKKKYKDINDTLYWIVEQAVSGIDYCRDNFPKFNDLYDMYDYFNGRVKFKDDPSGTELIQHPQTLWEGNYWGSPGLGDCDCFTTLLLSTCWANGFNNCHIVLYGRKKTHPSHICLMVEDENEQPVYLDLTEKAYNTERVYPYKQKIPVF